MNRNAEEQHLIQGPAGDLEILVTRAENANAVAIICHPHPLHGGTMHNKVVSTLMRAARDQGASTVRFNFRGVGQSTGRDRKSTRLNSSHVRISYAVFCLKKKKKKKPKNTATERAKE